MNCPNCKSIVPDGSQFCEACGSSVFIQCPSCGEKVKPDSEYCPSCGIQIEQFIEKKRKSLEELLNYAEEFVIESKYQYAAKCLKKIIVEEDDNFADIRSKAQSRYNEVVKIESRLMAERIDVVNKANKLIKTGQYQKVFQLIDELPDHMKDQEILSVKNHAADMFNQAKQYTSKINNALGEMDWQSAKSLINEFLSIQPHRKDMAHTLVEVEKKIIGDCKQKGNRAFIAGQYRTAVDYWKQSIERDRAKGRVAIDMGLVEIEKDIRIAELVANADDFFRQGRLRQAKFLFLEAYNMSSTNNVVNDKILDNLARIDKVFSRDTRRKLVIAGLIAVGILIIFIIVYIFFGRPH